MTAISSGRECRVIRNEKIEMRDGVKLSTTVYLPKQPGSFPVVLIRTAYNRLNAFIPALLKKQIALVAQDCRGRYDSEGDLYPFIHEPEDGYDTLEWIGHQPWCDGAIGMLGDSYLAATQFAAAPLNSPYLKALNPRFMAGDCWKRAYYCDGVFSLALTWSWLCFEAASRTSEAAMMPLFDVQALLRKLPVMTLDEESGAGVVQSYRDYVRHAHYDQHWEQLNFRDAFKHYTMPVFLIGGWYDNYAAETTANFLALRETAPDQALRDSHRLLIGPWTHGINPSTVLGELDFGDAALQENDASYRWLDCILHGRKADDFQKAPIRIFVMGLNQWRDEYEWPLARTRFTAFYLHEHHMMDTRRPTTEEMPDRYTYDPEHPVPTLGGNHSVGPYNPGLYDFVKPGPYDQGTVEQRQDVLVYTTDVLERDTEITGPVVVSLYAASSAYDTDFVARLTDVYPDGRSMNVTEGVIRARFREDTWGLPKLLEKDKAYLYKIDLQVTSIVIRQGHRIRVCITSSNFPLWDRNLNTGHETGTDTTMEIAHQTIFHDLKRPSQIMLPIIPDSNSRL